MSQTGLTVFDSTIHTTNVWLNHIMEKLNIRDRRRAYHALGAVLHALRDRLSVEQAVALGAQLPLLVRGVYYEGWHPHGKPLKEGREEFLAHVAHAFGGAPFRPPEDIAGAVLQVIARHVTPGAVRHVMDTLPADIRKLWTEETTTVWG